MNFWNVLLIGSFTFFFSGAQQLHLNILLFQPVIVATQWLTHSQAAAQRDFHVPPDLPPAAATSWSCKLNLYHSIYQKNSGVRGWRENWLAQRGWGANSWHSLFASIPERECLSTSSNLKQSLSWKSLPPSSCTPHLSISQTLSDSLCFLSTKQLLAPPSDPRLIFFN